MICRRSGPGVGRKLKTVEAVFSAICRCAGELNSANSAPVWIIFTTKTVNQISVLYKILDDVLVGQVDAQFWGVVICTCNEIVILVMILSAIDSPVNEVAGRVLLQLIIIQVILQFIVMFNALI